MIKRYYCYFYYFINSLNVSFEEEEGNMLGFFFSINCMQTKLEKGEITFPLNCMQTKFIYMEHNN